MPYKRANGDQIVAQLAASQHGAIAIRQLVDSGISRSSVQDRIAAGRLHRVHRGVYAVGHPRLSQEGAWMAAVLTHGDRAVLSHQAAAALWRLLRPGPGPIDVTVPGDGGRRKRTGIRLHRSPSLQSVHVTRHRGIPVTKPARTIADLRRVAPVLAAKALRQAAVIGLHLPEEVEVDHTRSELEGRFLRLCRHRRLPMPEVNVSVGPYTVDFLWREKRLIVETDGYRYHRGRQAFENDRDRDAKLRLRGYEVARLSYRQVVDEPARVAAVLRTQLAE